MTRKGLVFVFSTNIFSAASNFKVHVEVQVGLFQYWRLRLSSSNECPGLDDVRQIPLVQQLIFLPVHSKVFTIKSILKNCKQYTRVRDR